MHGQITFVVLAREEINEPFNRLPMDAAKFRALDNSLNHNQNEKNPIQSYPKTRQLQTRRILTWILKNYVSFKPR